GGFGVLVVNPWSERERNIFQIQPEIAGKVGALAGVKAPAILPPALPSPGLFPVEFVIASTAEHEQIVDYAKQLADAATKSGLFAFPPILDVRIDQLRAKVHIDRDKVATMGLAMQGIGSDRSAMLSGNLVNRIHIEGRRHKVIQQVERAGRLSVEQLQDIHISGPNGSLIPLSAVATIEKGIEPRTLNRFQQLNAVKISGVAPRGLDDGLKFLETKAKEILPPGYRVGYKGESR